jgi:hypothetical protein
MPKISWGSWCTYVNNCTFSYADSSSIHTQDVFLITEGLDVPNTLDVYPYEVY